MGNKHKIKIVNLNDSSSGKNLFNKQNLHILEKTDDNIEEFEKLAFLNIISEDLSSGQKKDLINPPKIFADEKNLLATHWHPEFIPLEIAAERIKNTFPNAINKLIIPTQHNVLMQYNGYSGVEIDCFSPEFNRKIQLLLHFGKIDEIKSEKLKLIIEHTFKYRSKQLFDLIESLSGKPESIRILKAVENTGVGKNVVDFVRVQSKKLMSLINENIIDMPPLAIKNKLVRNFLDEITSFYGERMIGIAQIFVKAVKEIVKAEFDNSYFYSTSEIIHEARLLNAGIVVPHPEQFWPVLLAGYDVDGYEVWNPQSREYTEFLMQVVLEQNKTRKFKERPILAFMGDDTHMGEKARPLELRDIIKAEREIGVQPAWEDPDIKKVLIRTGYSKERIINEYRARIDNAN
jgi:hypothetical protein